jgi:hypothetical protein
MKGKVYLSKRAKERKRQISLEMNGRIKGRLV